MDPRYFMEHTNFTEPKQFSGSKIFFDPNFVSNKKKILALEAYVA